MRRYIQIRPRFFTTVVAVLLCNVHLAAAERITLPGGFSLGSSLEEAKRYAASRGWQLVTISPELPRSWIVKEQNIGIHVCNDTVTSVTENVAGNLDDFAQLVSNLRVKRGEPKLQVGSFMAGSTQISTIDASFAEVNGIGVVVQFSSTAGRLAISTNYFSDKCAEHPNDE